MLPDRVSNPCCERQIMHYSYTMVCPPVQGDHLRAEITELIISHAGEQTKVYIFYTTFISVDLK